MRNAYDGWCEQRRSLGGGRAPSTPPPPPPAPKVEDPDVQKAAAEALRRRKLARGYRSTIVADWSGGLKTTMGS